MGKQKLFEKKYSQDFSRFDVSYKLTNPISATKSKHKKYDKNYTNNYHNEIPQNQW